MSDTKDTGGPAFPLDELHPATGEVWFQHLGMTLRDYFAAKAMQSLCHQRGGWLDVAESMNKGEKYVVATAAEFSYSMADAMLEARKQ